MPTHARRILHSRAEALAVAACALAVTAHAQGPGTAGSSLLTNPASKNCIAKGGKLTFEYDGTGKEFGVCTFAENRQCEEWALLRGACPVGGVRSTGYVTPAGRYCAINGGAYFAVSNYNLADEQGGCALKGMRSCDASAYFNGTCKPTPLPRTRTAAKSSSMVESRFKCTDGKSIYVVVYSGHDNSVRLILSDGRTIDLPQTASGSGARYANVSGTVVFRKDGDTADLEERGKTTFSECRS